MAFIFKGSATSTSRLRPTSARTSSFGTTRVIWPSCGCGAAKPRAGEIGDAYAMLDLLWLLVTTVQAVARPRQDLILACSCAINSPCSPDRLDARLLGCASG